MRDRTGILLVALAMVVAAAPAALAEEEKTQSAQSGTTAPQEATPERTPDPAPAPDREAASDIRVAEVAVCRKVVERNPVEPGGSFPSGVGRLFCFTDVRDAGPSELIYHRWYLGDELVSEVPMEVRGPRWRCWSEKTILPGWSGSARVEIVTEEGEVLAEESFVLAAASPSASEEKQAPGRDSPAGERKSPGSPESPEGGSGS